MPIKPITSDITTQDKKERTCLLIDISVSIKRPYPPENYRKIFFKYKDQEIEIERIWSMMFNR